MSDKRQALTRKDEETLGEVRPNQDVAALFSNLKFMLGFSPQWVDPV